LKPKSQKSWINTTETDQIIPYTDGILSSQFSMDHRFNLRIIEHSTNITGQKRMYKITFQCSSLAIQLQYNYTLPLLYQRKPHWQQSSREIYWENTQTIARENAGNGPSGNQTGSCVDKTRDTIILRDRKEDTRRVLRKYREINRTWKGGFYLVSTSKIINLVQNILYIRYV